MRRAVRPVSVVVALLVYRLDVVCLTSTPEDLDAFFGGSYQEETAPSLAAPIPETVPPKAKTDDTWAAAKIHAEDAARREQGEQGDEVAPTYRYAPGIGFDAGGAFMWRDNNNPDIATEIGSGFQRLAGSFGASSTGETPITSRRLLSGEAYNHPGV